MDTHPDSNSDIKSPQNIWVRRANFANPRTWYLANNILWVGRDWNLEMEKKKMKTKDDIKELMNVIFKELQETREAGQKEYAHDTSNAFGNFERLSATLKISREHVLWVYVTKHLDGIVSWINGHKSQREDVRGRIKDVIVYLILLWGMVDDLEGVGYVNVGTEGKPVNEVVDADRRIPDSIGASIEFLEMNGYECRYKG